MRHDTQAGPLKVFFCAPSGYKQQQMVEEAVKKKRGDSSRLQEWRKFLAWFRKEHKEECAGKAASKVSRMAGATWRKHFGKSKADDDPALSTTYWSTQKS